MTAIVGVAGPKGFLLGDRRVTDGTGHRWVVPAKVFAGPYLLAGAAGLLACVKRIERAVAKAEHPSELVECVDDESEALALFRGKLWSIDSDEAYELPQKVFAIGSGGDEARAFMAGRGGDDEAAARAALKFVADVRNDCGDGMRLVRAPGRIG